MAIDPYQENGWAIVGPYGNIWHPNVFRTPDEAKDHIQRFWKNRDIDWSEWKVVSAVASVKAVEDSVQREAIALSNTNVSMRAQG